MKPPSPTQPPPLTPKRVQEWCRANNLTQPRLENVLRVRDQLLRLCRDRRYPVESCANNFLPLRKAICYGLFQNACRYDPELKCYRLVHSWMACPASNDPAQPGGSSGAPMTVKIHPSSCLARAGAVVPSFVFTDLVQTSGTYAKEVCPVEREWVQELARKCSSNGGGGNGQKKEKRGGDE